MAREAGMLKVTGAKTADMPAAQWERTVLVASAGCAIPTLRAGELAEWQSFEAGR